MVEYNQIFLVIPIHKIVLRLFRDMGGNESEEKNDKRENILLFLMPKPLTNTLKFIDFPHIALKRRKHSEICSQCIHEYNFSFFLMYAFFLNRSGQIFSMHC